MAHLTLYRKYRSQSFSDLVGQNHVVRSLQNALSRKTHVQAYLFTGPRGTGKTSTARLLAKALNCEHGPSAEPCNECATCLSISEGSCFDVIELDAASEAGVDDVREKIVEVAEYPPGFCRYRVIILDEVHDLSAKAFDALLKTVEEPPTHLVFILATTEFQKVPPTIRSRCQKFEFHRGTVQDIAARLQHVATLEGIQIEPSALSALARMADGGFRDALTLLEQAWIMADGTITIEQVYDQLGLLEEDTVDRILFAIQTANAEELLQSLDAVAQRGRDPRMVLESMMYRLADLNRAALGVDQSNEGTVAASMREAASRLGMEAIVRLRSQLAGSHKAIRDISLPRIWLEAELIRISRYTTEAPATKTTPKSTNSVPAPAAPPKAAIEAPEAKVAPLRSEKQDAMSKAPEASHGPEQPETGDETTDRAIRAWKETVALLWGPGGSKSLATKLASSRVVSFEDNKITVAFDRKIDFDGVTAGPSGQQKRAMILEKLRAACGDSWEIEYRLNGDRTAPSIDEPAVELPVEGRDLHDAVREVFPGT